MRGFVLAVALVFSACATLPPQSSPAAQVAFRNMQIIKGLDLLRDVTIDAHNTQLVSENTTRQIVLFHQSALKVLDASSSGWRPIVGASFEETVKRIPAVEQSVLGPYLSLVGSLLKEE